MQGGLSPATLAKIKAAYAESRRKKFYSRKAALSEEAKLPSFPPAGANWVKLPEDADPAEGH